MTTTFLSTIAQFGPRGGGHRGEMLVGFLLLLGAAALALYGVAQLWKGRETGHAVAGPAAPAYAPTAARSWAASPSARVILDERYARGDIDEATYLRQVSVLATGAAPVTEPAAEAAPEVPVAEAAAAPDGEAAPFATEETPAVAPEAEAPEARGEA